MPSKFFGNRFDKQSNNKGKNSNKKSAKNKLRIKTTEPNLEVLEK